MTSGPLGVFWPKHVGPTFLWRQTSPIRFSLSSLPPAMDIGFIVHERLLIREVNGNTKKASRY